MRDRDRGARLYERTTVDGGAAAILVVREPRCAQAHEPAPGAIGDRVDEAVAAERAWVEVLGLVSETLETLVDSFLHRVMADEAYSRSAITVDDLRTSSLRTFTALLESLAATNGHDAELERIAIDLGKRRAQQGIALDSLMKAVRLDFSVLWSALCEDSIQADPRLLVARTERVWQTVDRYALHVQEHYLHELALIQQENADLEGHYIGLLLGSVAPTEVELKRIAGALQVPSGVGFKVAVVARLDGPIVRRRLPSRGTTSVRYFAYDAGRHTVVFWTCPPDEFHALSAREAAVFDGMACGLAPPAAHLGGVRSAVAAGHEIMTDLPMGSSGIMTLGDRWVSIARHQLDAIGCELAQLIDPLLAGCPPPERERIIETVNDFLETGSLVETSGRLFCHRNTVVNRLRAFERLTGIDLKKPKEAALAVVALRGPARA